ncbi:MAG: histone family protein [Candidatus Caldarchaeum sp.]
MAVGAFNSCGGQFTPLEFFGLIKLITGSFEGNFGIIPSGIPVKVGWANLGLLWSFNVLEKVLSRTTEPRSMSDEQSDFPSAPIHRLMKKAGAGRVSEDAAEELKRVLESVGAMIAKEAHELAQYAGRRTVKKEDVERAARTVLRGVIGS